jgi:hypothetical protein
MVKESETHLVTVQDVTVLRAFDYALLCRIETHIRLILMDQVRDGSTIRDPGDVGVLIVSKRYATEWGLLAWSPDRRRVIAAQSPPNLGHYEAAHRAA